MNDGARKISSSINDKSNVRLKACIRYFNVVLVCSKNVFDERLERIAEVRYVWSLSLSRAFQSGTNENDLDDRNDRGMTIS